MYSAARPLMQADFPIWKSLRTCRCKIAHILRVCRYPFLHGNFIKPFWNDLSKKRHQGFRLGAVFSLYVYACSASVNLFHAKHHAQNTAEELRTTNNDYLHRNPPFLNTDYSSISTQGGKCYRSASVSTTKSAPFCVCIVISSDFHSLLTPTG